MPKNFTSYINSLRNQTKKIYNTAIELYWDVTIFVFRFFIVYFPKNIDNKKWPNAADFSLHLDFNSAFSEKYFLRNFIVFLYFVLNKIQTCGISGIKVLYQPDNITWGASDTKSLKILEMFRLKTFTIRNSYKL